MFDDLWDWLFGDGDEDDEQDGDDANDPANYDEEGSRQYWGLFAEHDTEGDNTHLVEDDIDPDDAL